MMDIPTRRHGNTSAWTAPRTALRPLPRIAKTRAPGQTRHPISSSHLVLFRDFRPSRFTRNLTRPLLTRII